MNITSDLFLDCIVLLIHDNGEKHKRIVSELIALYETETRGRHASLEKDSLISFYIRVLKGLITGKFDPSNKDECRHYLLKMRSDIAMEKRRDLFDMLSDTFLKREEMSATKLEEIARGIQNQLVWNRMNKAARTMFGKLGDAKDMVDPQEQAKVLTDLLGGLQETLMTCTAAVQADHAGGMVDRVNFGDRESMAKALSKHKERAVTGVIKTGLQGINRMLKEGGFIQGESIVFNALSHHYKSGILQSMAMWAQLYNTPVIPPSGKKPMILMISLENEAFQNFIWISRKVYFQETGLNSSDLTQEELIEWTHQRFNQSGYSLEVLRYLPNEFGYEEVVALTNYYEQLGYHIVMMVIDYMNNMRKGDVNARVSEAGNHLLVKGLYNKVCNYTKTKGTTLVTAHQLNRKAQELANQKKTYVVKHFNSEHLADSMDVQREVDTSFYMHIENNHEGFPFLTIRLDKRRYQEGIAEGRRLCAYPFLEGRHPSMTSMVLLGM